MRIIELAIENFRSFRGGPHVQRLGALSPGLHFITGENRVDTELGANGAGKSSVFDAVNYALFGKTLQGLTGGAVVTWGTQQCSVRIRVAVAGGEIEIHRGRKGRTNFLRMNGGESVQDDVDRAIGLTESLFAQALVRRQFAVMFFDRAPAEQLKMLTEVLELEYWDSKSEAVKNRVRELADDERERESEIIRKEAKREAALRSAAEAKQSADDCDAQHVKDIASAQQSLDASKALVVEADRRHKENLKAAQEVIADRDSFAKSCAKDYDAAAHKHAELSGAATKGNADLESVRASRAQSADIARQHHEQSERINAAKTQWQNRIRHFESLSGNCPTCEQSIGAEHVGACISVANKEIADCDGQLEAALQAKKDADAVVAKLDSTINVHEDALKIRRDEIDRAEKAMQEAQRLVNTADRESAAAQQHMSVLKAWVNPNTANHKAWELKVELLNEWQNPHTATVKAETDKANALAAEIKSDKASLAVLQRDKSNVEFWIDGFRRIRLFVVDRAIATLEVEVNASLSSLGLHGYQIRFATERVTKAGGVSRKFDVLVDCPAAGKESVPLAAWSGGEYQRLRLACELGVSNMILKARGIVAEFEVWDEPTTHLSAEGVESLMVALRERAYALRRQVFIIDHVAHSFAFDSVTRVVKTADGSRFESEDARAAPK